MTLVRYWRANPVITWWDRSDDARRDVCGASKAKAVYDMHDACIFDAMIARCCTLYRVALSRGEVTLRA